MQIIYFSWFPDPEAFSVDAFLFAGINLNFYAFPTLILIPQVLREIINGKTKAVVVVP